MKSSDLIPYARILQVANGADLNSVLVPGTYYLYGSVTNNPSGDALGANSILEVQAGRGTSLVQRVLSATTGNMYYRWAYNINTSPVWSAWRKLTDSTSSLVNSFNGRTGAVTLASGDVTNALGFTPLSTTTGDARYPVLQNTVMNNQDLNTLVNAGMYRLNVTPTNGPGWSTGQYSNLLVVHGPGDTVWQMLVDHTNGYVSYRYGNPPPIGTGSWQPWQFFVTSKNQTMSIGYTGYLSIPGGLILQWGIFGPVGSGTFGPYSFPIAFPSNVWPLVISGIGSNQVEVTAGSLTTSQFKFTVAAGSNVYASWIAIGN